MHKNLMFYKIILPFLVLFSFAASANCFGADDADPELPQLSNQISNQISDQASEQIADQISDEDAAEMKRLMSILEEHTEIATKTRLNADFVPGMVTVLYRDDLEARGIRTMWEALRLVPGMDMPVQTNGGKDILVRGVADNYLSGNTKLLLDGVSMNIMLYAEASAPVHIPIELIDRIEVIRGPGSAIHGEFAYTSVVNIITRKKENLLFSGLSRYNDYRLGGLLSWADAKGIFHVNLSMSATETEDTDIMSGPDILYGMGMGEISNAPGPINDSRDFHSVLFDTGYKNTSLKVQYLQTDNGNSYGFTSVLPYSEKRKSEKSDQYLIEVMQKINFSSSLDSILRLGWMKYQFEFEKVLLYPPGYLGIYTDGMLASIFYEEYRLNSGIDIIWKGWEHNTLLAGYSVVRIDMGDVWAESNFNPVTLEPLPYMNHYEGDVNYLVEDQTRTIHSITVQDEFRMSDFFTITAGLRYDVYNDVGESFSPRLAAVWRLTDRHILKAQYARAFRPPTFSELYSLNNPVITGNTDLEFSNIDTYETGYIYKRENMVGRITFFFSELNEMVVQGRDKSVSNQGSAKVFGSELEIDRELTDYLKVNASLSYVNAEDEAAGSQIEGSANWMANAGLLYRPFDKIALNLQYRYVGERNRAPQDPREDLRGYHNFDFTFSSFNTFFKGLTFRTGIKNLFNEDERTPAPMGTDLYGNPIPTYPEDYSYSGREWWAKITYVF